MSKREYVVAVDKKKPPALAPNTDVKWEYYCEAVRQNEVLSDKLRSLEGELAVAKYRLMRFSNHRSLVPAMRRLWFQVVVRFENVVSALTREVDCD